MKQCYLCGLAVPDLIQQSQIQKEMMAEARREAEREVRDRVEREAQRIAEAEVREAAGIDRVQPLQFNTFHPPGNAISYISRDGTTSLVLAKSINPHTYFMDFPQGAWLPGDYQLVVWCDPVIPANRLEWFVRFRAVSFDDGPEAIATQRSQPFGEWIWLRGLDSPGYRAAWCPVQCDAPGDYEFGVSNGYHGGHDAEPAWLARSTCTLWHPPEGTGRCKVVRSVLTQPSSIAMGGDSTPPPAPPGTHRPIAQAGAQYPPVPTSRKPALGKFKTKFGEMKMEFERRMVEADAVRMERTKNLQPYLPGWLYKHIMSMEENFQRRRSKK